MHRTAQQRIAVLQSTVRQHKRFSADRDEVATQLFAVLAHVPRKRVRSGRGLFVGFAATDKEQLRVCGHILQERGGGEV